MVKDKKIKRPYWCYDKIAKVLYSTYNKEQYKEGFSMFCYGMMAIPRNDKFNKVKHINNLCHCYYTPLKGAIRFFINIEDVWGELWAKIAVMNKVVKGKCIKHPKEKSYRTINYQCSKCAKEKFNQQ